MPIKRASILRLKDGWYRRAELEVTAGEQFLHTKEMSRLFLAHCKHLQLMRQVCS